MPDTSKYLHGLRIHGSFKLHIAATALVFVFPLAHNPPDVGSRLPAHFASHRPLETRHLSRIRNARPATRCRLGGARAGCRGLECATRRRRSAALALAQDQVVLRRPGTSAGFEVCGTGTGVEEWRRTAGAEHRVGAERCLWLDLLDGWDLQGERRVFRSE